MLCFGSPPASFRTSSSLKTRDIVKTVFIFLLRIDIASTRSPSARRQRATGVRFWLDFFVLVQVCHSVKSRKSLFIPGSSKIVCTNLNIFPPTSILPENTIPTKTELLEYSGGLSTPTGSSLCTRYRDQRHTGGRPHCRGHPILFSHPE